MDGCAKGQEKHRQVTDGGGVHDVPADGGQGPDLRGGHPCQEAVDVREQLSENRGFPYLLHGGSCACENHPSLNIDPRRCLDEEGLLPGGSCIGVDIDIGSPGHGHRSPGNASFPDGPQYRRHFVEVFRYVTLFHHGGNSVLADLNIFHHRRHGAADRCVAGASAYVAVQGLHGVLNGEFPAPQEESCKAHDHPGSTEAALGGAFFDKGLLERTKFSRSRNALNSHQMAAMDR